MVLEQQVVQTSQAGFDAVRKAFTAGVRDNIDVLNAQSQVYAAQQNLLSATVDALAAQANILALLGELSPPTIAPLTAVMVPADNAPPTP
jgi:outer membrane protein